MAKTRTSFQPGPGFVESLTESWASHPLNRIATAEKIAAGILYLACADARFVTGAALDIDGGFGDGQ